MKETSFRLQEKEVADLRIAKELLEKEGIAIKMANLFGDVAEKLVKRLPPRYRETMAMYNVATIGKAWELTMTTLSASDVPPESEMRHKLYATISGAVGGVGILTLFAELPVSTIIMLRAVADIAKDEGEDYDRPETKMACLEVFALGGNGIDNGVNSGQTGYYAIRASLEKPLPESSKHIAKKGVAGMGAPFAAQLTAKIAAKYQPLVSAKIAAKGVPIAGALIGAGVNIVFINLFQDKARGHFIVRRLEKKYGIEEVRQKYDAITTKTEKDKIVKTKIRELPNTAIDKILRHHVWASMGVGMIPIPIADVAGLTIVHLNLLRTLAKAYDVPYSKGAAKTIISSLAGGMLPVSISGPLAASLAKLLPVIGQAAGAVTMPVVSGAATYAVGKVFIQHFASGGTFLTFDPDKVKAYYAQMFREGEEIADGIEKVKAMRIN